MTNPPSYAVFRECQNSDCNLRFPDICNLDISINCPICGSAAIIKEVTDLTEDHRDNNNLEPPREFTLILDNVRSVYNVGAIFRTAVGLGLNQVYLCGITPTPNHKNFTKTSLGAENSLKWKKSLNCVEQCKSLKEIGYHLISIETTSESISLINMKKDNFYGKKIAVIVGNEITGIDPEVLFLSDLVISIPIIGKNKSFNVTTALGIALFHLISLSSI
ncbi:MAG: TrmH family RNA methyltransferase [Promethearchaeota archaeon]